MIASRSREGEGHRKQVESRDMGAARRRREQELGRHQGAVREQGAGREQKGSRKGAGSRKLGGSRKEPVAGSP